MTAGKRPGRQSTLRAVAASLEAAELPPPVKRIIGDLSNKTRTLVGMELVPEP